MSKKEINDCIVILSSIFVKWRFLVITTITLSVTFAGVSFKGGMEIQKQNSRISINESSYMRIEKKIDVLKNMIDTLLYMQKE